MMQIQCVFPMSLKPLLFICLLLLSSVHQPGTEFKRALLSKTPTNATLGIVVSNHPVESVATPPGTMAAGIVIVVIHMDDGMARSDSV